MNDNGSSVSYSSGPLLFFFCTLGENDVPLILAPFIFDKYGATEFYLPQNLFHTFLQWRQYIDSETFVSCCCCILVVTLESCARQNPGCGTQMCSLDFSNGYHKVNERWIKIKKPHHQKTGSKPFIALAYHFQAGLPVLSLIRHTALQGNGCTYI